MRGRFQDGADVSFLSAAIQHQEDPQLSSTDGRHRRKIGRLDKIWVVLNEQTLADFTLVMNNMRSLSEQALGTIGDVDALVATERFATRSP